MIYVGRRGASQRPLKLDNGSLLVHLWARNERPFFTLAPVLYNRCPSTIDTLDTLLSLISMTVGACSEHSNKTKWMSVVDCRIRN